MINEDFQNENEIHVHNEYFINMWKSNKLFTDDYIRLINSHWLEFMPPKSYLYYGWGILFAIVMILGCTGNALAIFIILKFKSLQKSIDILMLNLAISDLILLANSTVVIYNSYYQGPALGNLGCQIDGFIGSLTKAVSTMTLNAISLDRYYAVIRPLKSLGKHTKHRARIWIGMIWIYGLLFSIIPLLDFDYGFTPTGFLISCTFDFLSDDIIDKWIMVIFYIISAWLLPFTIVFYCYIKMSIAVYANSEATNSRIGQSSTKKKTKFIFGLMTMSAMVLNAMTFTPNAIVVILGVLEKKEFITPIIMMLLSLSSNVCSCVNPWLYIILPESSRTRV
ncbi:opsin-2-like [Metopolophium dirhodum]|uniref:opsin-2-like n=1 Tax=Metopolophium dirhodum TaxID=44670 RepID=UPI00298F6300|nr:opsin-2-like [Metopolophium dirhodum]